MPNPHPRRRLRLISPIVFLLAAMPLASTTAAAAPQCEYVGQWVVPGKPGAIASDELTAAMAERDIVMLGESHTSANDHRWQLHSLAALRARRPDMVIGLEMFPRSVQPVLDRWVAGDLSEKAFLKESRWDQVWGYDADFYLPIFHFARQYRIPMRAVNVDRSLIAKVGRGGWASVPKAERQGIGDPAPAAEAYREMLSNIFSQHSGSTRKRSEDKAEQQKGFERFVQAQLTWDRAMAEGLAAAHRKNPDALVVGIIGRGHLEHGHGVPHQLADLGVAETAVLLTADAGTGCPELTAGLADAVFLFGNGGEAAKAPTPRLGVMIESGDQGVRVMRVVKGSVAEEAKIAQSDIIVSAAGLDVRKSSELIEIVRRQAPGTWLPLIVRRGDNMVGIVAKFPKLTGRGE